MRVAVVVLALAACSPGQINSTDAPDAATGPAPKLDTIFLILMENHDWSTITSAGHSSSYIQSLLAAGAHATRYMNPPGNHPSLPNYIWLEAGDNFQIADDNGPSSHPLTTDQHLVDLLETAGVSWKSYDQGVSGSGCPTSSVGDYAVKHDPFVYFTDVNGDPNRCETHVRPLGELDHDLGPNGVVARYNFITPDLCHDMHDSCAPTYDSIAQGDGWLASEIPKIQASKTYAHAAILVTWDEGEPGDGPIGMIALSPFARAGVSSDTPYDHSSTLRTVEEIMGVSQTTLLGGAASATDLADLFAAGAIPQ
jgi:hypothetical protein